MTSHSESNDSVVEEFSAAWSAVSSANEPPPLANALSNHAPVWAQEGLATKLLRIDVRERLRRSMPIEVDRYVKEIPEFELLVRSKVPELIEALNAEQRERELATIAGEPYYAELASDQSEDPVELPQSQTAIPSQIGAYRVEKLLGSGAFSDVYLGYHSEIQQRFAIKVLKNECSPADEMWGGLQHEAQQLAALSHRSIVRFFQLDRHEGQRYLVVEYVDGGSLAELIQEGRPSILKAVELVSEIAEGLHSAHEQGVIHRDLKPANILLDQVGRPRIADFGLALSYSDFGSGPRVAGTYRYMSPEQARHEAHRVDGRSDLFSLGAIFYELLTGTKAFKGSSVSQLLDWVINNPPQPLRQANAEIPEELERICLRCLEKRASDRYTCGKDLVADLDAWMHKQSDSHETIAQQTVPQVVPKGLRSFDANDAEFFISLLPGPRDRHGDPETIRFWKVWAEQTGDTDTAVGVVYGPSGCGKSSLIRAGLLPRLAAHVDLIEVNAEGGQTADTLLRRLKMRYTEFESHKKLSNLLLELRDSLQKRGRKLLLVIDQFEQYLHTKVPEERSELIAAMRQCDGISLSALLVTRDDFWLSLKRFMDRIEIPIRDGRNSLLVDLFDEPHARNVLRQLGQALGKLPPDDTLSEEHESFLADAMQFLAPEGVASPVQIAVFVELMKRRSWTPRTLRNFDSLKALGVAFLEEVFDRSVASRARANVAAAQRVLTELLPESDKDLKGSAQSRGHLKAAAIEADRNVDFDELMNLLVNNYRLLSPSDIDLRELDSVSGSKETLPLATHSYQLTHDYLVPSIREWLRRKKSRTELLLARRTDDWRSEREVRHLPSLVESVRIATATRRGDWSKVERAMMQAAGRRHAFFVCVFAIIVGGLAWAIIGYRQMNTQRLLIQNLLAAEPAKVIPLSKQIRKLGSLNLDTLKQLAGKRDLERAELIKAGHVLSNDPDVIKALNEVVASKPRDLPPMELPYFILALESLLEAEALDKSQLETAVLETDLSSEVRFRAAAALLHSGSTSEANSSILAKLAANRFLQLDRTTREEWLVKLDSAFAETVRDELLKRLKNDRTKAEREFDTLRESFLARGDVKTAAALVNWADIEQIGRILPMNDSPNVLRELEEDLDDLRKEAFSGKSREERVDLARRTANTAAALLSANPQLNVWKLLTAGPGDNPEVAYRLAIILGENMVATEAVLDRLSRADKEDPPSQLAKLLLIIGIADRNGLQTTYRKRYTEITKKFYCTHTDPGVHAAAAWTLNVLGDLPPEAEQLPPVGSLWRYADETLFIEFEPATTWIGSPIGEIHRDTDGWVLPNDDKPSEIEQLRKAKTGRFLIAAFEETVGRFQRHIPNYKPINQFDQSTNQRDPVHQPSWDDIGSYCNQLSKTENLDPAYNPETKRYDTSVNGYRLPKSDEWEVAARSGSRSSRHYGEADTLLDRFAWYAGNSAAARYNPVAQLLPNQAGLFDTLGNVSELCCDGPLELYELPESGIPMKSAVAYDGLYRVHRGSAYNDSPAKIRSAVVWGTEAGDADSRELGSVGFRLARTLLNGD